MTASRLRMAQKGRAGAALCIAAVARSSPAPSV